MKKGDVRELEGRMFLVVPEAAPRHTLTTYSFLSTSLRPFVSSPRSSGLHFMS